MFTRIALLVSALVALAAAGAGGAAADPTCSGTLEIEAHGQHVIGDYVTGIGHTDLAWPPAGGVVGDAMQGGGGVATAGGPGPGFHFPNGFAPGASFCLDQSQSPGKHPGP